MSWAEDMGFDAYSFCGECEEEESNCTCEEEENEAV
jgi:hypothetical protein